MPCTRRNIQVVIEEVSDEISPKNSAKRILFCNNRLLLNKEFDNKKKKPINTQIKSVIQYR